MKLEKFISLPFIVLALGLAKPAEAILVTYTGNQGLSASADYSLLDATTLQIVVTNTSTSPFGTGGANAVLSSLNFDLGGVDIVGGSAALTNGSNVVERDGSAWATVSPTPDLNPEWGFSNDGVGNTQDSFGDDALSDALNTVTAHSNGGQGVTTFAGGSGVPGGLDYSLIPTGLSPFGNNTNWILSSVTITLLLDGALDGLGFLENGSYVEFGSDHAYITSGDLPSDPEPVIPEPSTLALLGWGLSALSAGAAKRRIRRRQLPS